jgi:hypothetical protein
MEKRVLLISPLQSNLENVSCVHLNSNARQPKHNRARVASNTLRPNVREHAVELSMRH